ncbi:hypothetical protein DOZ80_15905 [Pseudomonas fluorescens]|uniref:Uncharacterized protein n=1 Tax=Pseudomonas fluorescens TaxID=294 RepID=A0A327N2N1_PSEFL|nr:hypothetical protein DOZ80_15905 [Pseudomonas fluorescens]
MGASLLAIAIHQSLSMLTDLTPSRASSLPQWFVALAKSPPCPIITLINHAIQYKFTRLDSAHSNKR